MTAVFVDTRVCPQYLDAVPNEQGPPAESPLSGRASRLYRRTPICTEGGTFTSERTHSTRSLTSGARGWTKASRRADPFTGPGGGEKKPPVWTREHSPSIYKFFNRRRRRVGVRLPETGRRTQVSILTRHVGHVLLVLDAERARCEACAHTLVLGSTSSTSTHASTVKLEVDLPPRFGEAGTCLRHPGEWAGERCRCCAADRKQTRVPLDPPRADPDRIQRGVALVRAAASQAKSAPKETK